MAPWALKALKDLCGWSLRLVELEKNGREGPEAITVHNLVEMMMVYDEQWK